MDNPISWMLLVIAMVIFFGWLANKAMNDYDERRREAEKFWENYHK